jgi:hypothetical protein
MTTSREDRAGHVLWIAEMAARNIQPDIEDVDDPGNAAMLRAWDALTSKIRYLMPRAAASWKPEFQAVLNCSHSMRVEKIAVDMKSQLQGFTGVCMACGREERNCRYSIDLAGPFDPWRWIKGADQVSPEYATFINKYEETFSKGFLNCATHRGKLPDTDMGTYVVGETCLRKAKLVYLLQTMVMDRCYAAEREMEAIAEKEEHDGNFELAEQYTVTDEAAADLVQRQDAIELAIADEKRPVPEIETDSSFWEVIDEGRNLVSNGDPGRFNQIIRERAKKMLRGLKRPCSEDERGEDDEEEEGWGSACDDASGEDDDPDHPDERPHSTKRRRTCVVNDADDDDDEEEEEGVEEGVEGARAGAQSGTAGSFSAGTSREQLPRCLSSRVPPPSASAMAGMQRAAGNLPSRRATLVSLMELQIRLARQEKHEDAAVCTNAIQTLQELIQRVDELAHSVES